jgi:UDP-N-acetylglucosamine 2-epimerase (non-hydrolysing)
MNAKFVMTDSGGIQEATTVLGIPYLTLRNITERPITITQGTNVLVWNDTHRITDEAFKILDGKGKAGSCPELWDGNAAGRIVEILATCEVVKNARKLSCSLPATSGGQSGGGNI